MNQDRREELESVIRREITSILVRRETDRGLTAAMNRAVDKILAEADIYAFSELTVMKDPPNQVVSLTGRVIRSVHFSHPENVDLAVCDKRPRSERWLTDIPGLVSCKRCKRSSMFRAADVYFRTSKTQKTAEN